MRKTHRKVHTNKFLTQYNRHFNSISHLLKGHKNKQFIGYTLNLLEGVTSVERLSRELQRDFNLTFRLTDEIKDANAELYKDLPHETFNKVTELFAELIYLISQRLTDVQLSLYHNRETPHTRVAAMPPRKPKSSRRKYQNRKSKK